MVKSNKSNEDDYKLEYDVVELQLGKDPVLLKCRFCRSTGHTTVSPKMGIGTWLWCIGIFLVGGVCGCCLIPFFLKCSRDVGHRCHSCDKYIGRYDKVRRKAVRR